MGIIYLTPSAGCADIEFSWQYQPYQTGQSVLRVVTCAACTPSLTRLRPRCVESYGCYSSDEPLETLEMLRVAAMEEGDILTRCRNDPNPEMAERGTLEIL